MPPALYALASALLATRRVMSAGGVRAALLEAAGGVPAGLGMASMAALAGIGLIVGCVARPPARRIRRGLTSISPVLGLSALAVLLACLTSEAALAAGRALARSLEDGDIGAWELTVMTDPSRTDAGAWRVRVHAAGDGLPEGDLWLTTTTGLEVGDVVRVRDGFVANAQDEWGRINRAQGVWGRIMPRGGVTVEGPRGLMAPIRALRDSARAVIAPHSSEERAILAGCVIGDRRAMDAFGLDGLFSACGVSHLIAVSGGHIVIMAQLLEIALGRTRLRPLPRLALLVVLSGIYVLLTAAPAPATRSWAMSVIVQGARIAGRRSDSLSAAALVGLAMVLVDPGCAGQIGFLLSIVCVVGLCLFASYLTYALRVVVGGAGGLRIPLVSGCLRRLATSVCETLGATLVAQIVTLPVTVPVFMQVSLVAPLANLALTLPFTLLIGVGLVIACLPMPPGVTNVALACCDAVTSCMTSVLRVLGRVPFASIPLDLDALGATVGVGVAGAVILVTWPRLTRRGAAAMLAIPTLVVAGYLVRWGCLAPSRIVMLDIGQGDAILVQEGPHALLVDAGPDEAIRRALARNHVLRLDAVLITHLHADHYGGVTSLPGFVAVGDVLVADGVRDSGDASGYGSPGLTGLRDAIATLTDGSGVSELSYGDTLHVGAFDLRCVWPTGEVAGTVNAESIELAVTYGRGEARLSALLTGDAEHDETSSVVGRGDVGHVDLLKVGHHGSAVSLDDEVAASLSPTVAVASAGEGNPYGHPTDECRDVLSRVGACFLCTRDVGDVSIEPGVRGLRVRCQRSRPDAHGGVVP